MTVCHLIFQCDLQTNFLETNEAGMFAIENQGKTLLEIPELE